MGAVVAVGTGVGVAGSPRGRIVIGGSGVGVAVGTVVGVTVGMGVGGSVVQRIKKRSDYLL